MSVQVAGEERSGRCGPSETRAAVLTVDFIGFWRLHGRAGHSIGMETFGARFRAIIPVLVTTHFFNAANPCNTKSH